MERFFKYFVALSVVLILSTGRIDALTGSWRGDLLVGQGSLPLVFNFTETAEGKTRCTLDSPAQGAKGIKSLVKFCSADSVSLKFLSIGASYNAKIVSPSEIKGVFKQGAYSVSLDLSPEIPIEERRPQTPRPPFPYTIVDTIFSAPDGAVFGATLTLPENMGKDKVPAIVMVTGSGPQNRDEEIFEHRPFAVIADFLARNGIASLRYDDRGTAASSGDFRTATTGTFKDDARSAIAFLRTVPGIGSTGVLGHSEGGTIAFMLGAERVPDFIVSLAGMAVSGKETLMRQNKIALVESGLDESEQESSLKLIGMVFDTMSEQNASGISTPVDVDSVMDTSGLDVNPQIVATLKMVQNTRTPWLDAFIGLEPAGFLKKVKCPVLAINGDKDTQVDADNLTLIHKFIPKAEIKLMPGLNHLLQHATTGKSDEYGSIRETISPEVLGMIVEFVKACR